MRGGMADETSGRLDQVERRRSKLFVRDHLADFGEVLFEFGDFLGPGAVGIRVGNSGGVLAFSFGEAFEYVCEAVLECWAGHNQERITRG